MEATEGSPSKKAKVDNNESTEKKTVEFEPPLASVQRILKSTLPDNCQVAKESKAAFTKAAGIFIIYLTSCANDFCVESKRSTISATDVIAAIKELEFADFIPQLEEFLVQFRLQNVSKKTATPTLASTGEDETETADAEGEADNADAAEDDETENADAVEPEQEGGQDENENAEADE